MRAAWVVIAAAAAAAAPARAAESLAAREPISAREAVLIDRVAARVAAIAPVGSAVVVGVGRSPTPVIAALQEREAVAGRRIVMLDYSFGGAAKSLIAAAEYAQRYLRERGRDEAIEAAVIVDATRSNVARAASTTAVPLRQIRLAPWNPVQARMGRSGYEAYSQYGRFAVEPSSRWWEKRERNDSLDERPEYGILRRTLAEAQRRRYGPVRTALRTARRLREALRRAFSR